MSLLYLKGFGESAGSFVFQPVPPCNEHSQFKWSSKCWRLAVAFNQSFSEDLHKQDSSVIHTQFRICQAVWLIVYLANFLLFILVCLGPSHGDDTSKTQNSSVAISQLTFPPPTPIPQLLSLSTLSVWQEGLFSSCSIPFTPSGPKALSLRSSSVSLAPAVIIAPPRNLWWKRMKKTHLLEI